MYGVPILAVLIVLPARQITSLNGLINAIRTVLTGYGGSIAADGHGHPGRRGQLLGWVCAFALHLGAAGQRPRWIMGAGRAQAAACLDGAGRACLAGFPATPECP